MSVLVVSSGDGICVHPGVRVRVLGQLHLQRPEQQGKDTGRSNFLSISSLLVSSSGFNIICM